MNTSKFADKLEEIMHDLGHYNVSFVHILGQPDVIGMVGQVYPQEPYRINTRLYRNASSRTLLGLIRKLVAVATRTLGQYRFEDLPTIVQLQIMLDTYLHPDYAAAYYYENLPVIMPIIRMDRLLPQVSETRRLDAGLRVSDAVLDRMIDRACEQTDKQDTSAVEEAIKADDFDLASRLAHDLAVRGTPTLADVLNQRGVLGNVHRGAPTQKEIDRINSEDAYEEQMLTDEELYRLQRFGDDAIDELIDDVENGKGN